MTKTSKETVERIAELLSVAGTIRTRNMMGGYLVYLDDVLVGQINNDHLHIKVTARGEKIADKLTKAEPYPGAKLAFRVPESALQDSDWVKDFLVGTRIELT